MDSDQNFNLYSQYYDLLYSEKDYKAEAAYVVDLIKKHNPNANSILELGSGTGKHARLFEECGYHVLGIERSSEMVAIALKQKKSNVKYQVSDISNFVAQEKFEVALSLFHVISYLTVNEKLIETFQNVWQHLQANGLFIFDVWHSPAVYHQRPENRTKKLTGVDVEVFRKAIPQIDTENNVVLVNYDIQIRDLKTDQVTTFTEKHPMRYFSFPEMELLARLTGFEVIATEEFFTKKTPSTATWGVCYILRKQKQADDRTCK